MFGKLVFVVATLLILQVSESRKIGLSHTIEHLRDVKNSVEQIKEILNNLSNEINKIDTDIPQALKQLADTLKYELEGMDLGKVVNDIDEKIVKILKEANIDVSTVQGCIGTEKESVTILVQDTNEEIKKCVTNVDNKTRAINDRTLQIKDEGIDMLKGFEDNLETCLQSASTQCLSDLLAKAKDQVSDIKVQIEDFISNTKDITLQVAFDLKKCMITIEMKVWDVKREILTDFKNCIKQ